jgi:probable rRNA maturation factor
MSPPGAALVGELVVSAEMACQSARELGVEPCDELALYVVHGLLHLCGWDDRNVTERERMREREVQLLTLAGIKSPYAASAGNSIASPEAKRA